MLFQQFHTGASRLGRGRGLSGTSTLLITGLLLAVLCARPIQADEFQLTLGGGPTPQADQTHYTVGMDYTFYRFERSSRQHLSIGASYTYIGSNASHSDSLYAISLFPQLTLLADERSWGKPFFFVRALGPSYISERQLGVQRQANHFTFQAQVGAGFYFDWSNNRRGFVSLSWKHFSNSSFFSPNDSIDLPVLLSIGTKF